MSGTANGNIEALPVELSETQTQAKRPPEHSWGLVAVLAVVYTGSFVDRAVLSLLTEPIKKDLGLSDFQLSLLLGLAFSLFYGLLNLPAGYVIDRLGRRGLIAGGSMVWTIMTVFCGLANSFGQLFVGRAGVGAAEAFITPASFSLIRDRVPMQHRVRAYSMFAMAPYVGSAIALSGGAALIALAQRGAFASVPVLSGLRAWQNVLFLVGLAGAPLPLLLFLLRTDIRDVATPDAKPTAPGWRDALAHMRAHARLYSTLIAYVTLGAAIAFGKSAWTPSMMARKFDLPIAQIGYVAGPVGLASGIGGLLICGWLLDRVAPKPGMLLKVAGGIMACCGAFSALTQVAPTPALSWTFYGVGNFFSGSFFSVGASILSRATPARLMGKITAIYLLFQNIVGAALGPVVIALLAQGLFSGRMALADALTTYFIGLGTIAVSMLLLLKRGLERLSPDSDD